MWRIEKIRKFPPKYEWEIFLSSHGLVMGTALTRRRAEKKLEKAQYWLLTG